MKKSSKGLNSKQIRITKFLMLKTQKLSIQIRLAQVAFNFGNLNFDIASNFW